MHLSCSDAFFAGKIMDTQDILANECAHALLELSRTVINPVLEPAVRVFLS